MDSNTKSYIINNCREQILKEAKALNRVAEQVDEEYIAACEAIFNCEGRVIVTGERVIIVTGCINVLESRVSGTSINNNSCIY